MPVQGVKGLTIDLKAHKEKSALKLTGALMKGGLFLQRKSQNLVPIDTNVLRASAETQIVKADGLDIEVTMGYGTDYGIYVHENLEMRHKPGKSAKFVEIPLRLRREELKAVIRKQFYK